ncbi:probable thiopurine S-methyltransferase [Haplochromis burtoni]|uniref:probable thiopurine S-methyltransferase n=1 Tax=Haplochromis burtoni TaxID=8153 RepID=UPI001C2CF86B|nr:probable thiopurine S-methyltransferase [Haplochromis burtoni]
MEKDSRMIGLDFGSCYPACTQPTHDRKSSFFLYLMSSYSLFGSSCDIELLQSMDAMTDLQRQWWLDKCTQNAYLITPKSS